MGKRRVTLLLPCDRKGGVVRGYVGDSVGITFAKSGKAHNVVSRGECRTITASCDHDLGVIVDERR